MVPILGNEHLRQRPLGRQPADDQVRRRGGLDDALFAGSAGVLRAHGDDDAKLRRHDVQPLGAVLADADHVPAPAGALGAVRFDNVLDPLQVLGQMTEVAARGAAPVPGRCRRGTRRGHRFLDLGHRALQVLERQLAVVKRSLLRALVVDRPAQLADQVLQAAVGIGEQIHPRAKLLVVRLLGLEQCPVGGRQRLQIDRFSTTLHEPNTITKSSAYKRKSARETGRPSGLNHPWKRLTPRCAGAVPRRGDRRPGHRAVLRRSRPSSRVDIRRLVAAQASRSALR